MDFEKLKKDIERMKEEKMKAEVLLERIEKDIKEKNEVLLANGISCEEDLTKMRQDIQDEYDRLYSKVEEYKSLLK